MKLAALLAAALLLVGCPGNTAQNAPTPPQGGSGRPETLRVHIAAPTPRNEALPPSPLSGVSALRDSQLQTDIPIVSFAHIGTAAGAIRGTARWFSTGPNGVAAAGPKLRAAIGRHWRGTLIRITAGGKTVTARLSDACWCKTGSIIDLPDELFRRLAPLSTGVLSVTVYWGDRNVLPATDTAP